MTSDAIVTASSRTTATRPFPNPDLALARFLLAQGDRALVLAQRLGHLVTRAPDMQDDLAIANMAIDLIGQSTLIYAHVGEIDGTGRTADDYAYWRDADQFLNPRLVERPDVDFAHTIVRQFLHDAYAVELWSELTKCAEPDLAAIAQKAVRETQYHLHYSSNWLIRLGAGIKASHARTAAALEALWPDVPGLFSQTTGASLPPELKTTDVRALQQPWAKRVQRVFDAATLSRPPVEAVAQPEPRHLDGFEQLINELQELQRGNPGALW